MVNGLSDATRVVFDDERVVANAGVLLPAVLADRLGIEALVDRAVDLGGRPGAANPGRKVMTMVSAMCLGADCIEDCGVLRSGQTSAVLGTCTVPVQPDVVHSATANVSCTINGVNGGDHNAAVVTAAADNPGRA